MIQVIFEECFLSMMSERSYSQRKVMMWVIGLPSLLHHRVPYAHVPELSFELENPFDLFVLVVVAENSNESETFFV